MTEAHLFDLDRWAFEQLHAMVTRCRAAYEAYEFHVVYHALNSFCTVELSAFYLDIVKDRLYCEAATGVLRRAAQTVCWQIADQLTRLMAPILSFTAEEVWGYLPKPSPAPASVFCADLPGTESGEDRARAARWERLRAIRGEAGKVLEAARKAKRIGGSLSARLVFAVNPDTQRFLESFGPTLADLFIVSEVAFGTPGGEFVLQSAEVPGLTVGAEETDVPKCARCWKRSPSVGSSAQYPDICARCAGVLG